VLAITGGGLVEYLLKQILPYAPSGKLVAISPQLLVASLGGAIVTGLVAGVYPASRAASMRPVQAIRSGD
jgi:putative ABC transport system permease protein